MLRIGDTGVLFSRSASQCWAKPAHMPTGCPREPGSQRCSLTLLSTWTGDTRALEEELGVTVGLHLGLGRVTVLPGDLECLLRPELDGISDVMDESLSKLREIVKDREA